MPQLRRGGPLGSRMSCSEGGGSDRTRGTVGCSRAGAAPALAKGIASIELASGAGRAAVAEPEARRCSRGIWQIRAQEQKATARRGRLRSRDAGEKGKGRTRGGAEALLQSEQDAPPRRGPDECALATWDPGSWRPVSESSIRKGQEEQHGGHRHPQQSQRNLAKNYSGSTITRTQPRTWYPSTTIPFYHSEILSSMVWPIFVLRPIQGA